MVCALQGVFAALLMGLGCCQTSSPRDVWGPPAHEDALHLGLVIFSTGQQ